MKTKYLFSGVAVIAALALSAPAWAQPANPSGGNSMGMPGPNPGGPGLTPSTEGAPPPATAPSANGEHGRMPAGGKKTSSRGGHIPSTPSASDTTSATPPMHHAYPHRHAKAMHAFHKGMSHKAALTSDTTAQLNRQELARIQTGNTTTPPATVAPMPGK